MDRKYTDLDVRSDRTLAPIAYEYLKQYTGEFQFLRECKSYYAEMGRLAHAHIRGVLNCMLADPKVRDMPVPTMKVFSASSYDLYGMQPVEYVRHAESPEEEAERELQRERSYSYPLPTRWRYPHGMSNHKRSHVIHTVDLTRSCAVLHPYFNKVTYVFHWACQSHRPPSPFEKTLALFSLDDAVLAIQTGNGSHLKHLTIGEKFRQFKWCAACDRATQVD